MASDQKNGDIGHKQAIRPDDKDVLFSEERMRENEERFGLDFKNMTAEKASEIQSKVDKDPNGEMAKAGVKEQAQHAVQQREDKESKKTNGEDVEEKKQQNEDRPESSDTQEPKILSEKQTNDQPESEQDNTSDDILSEKRMKVNQERFNINFETMTEEEAKAIQSEVDKDPEGQKAKSGLKEQVMHVISQRESRNNEAKVAKDDTSKEAFTNGHMPKERIDLGSQMANQPEISYTANGQNGTSKPKRKPPAGFFEWIGRVINSLYFSLCTVTREQKTEA